uniref:Uncharacterized protein n=1 Tax=Neolamprologus brichardi TaxID=32507 RepID=A0A3Q4N2Z8_NEOBR
MKTEIHKFTVITGQSYFEAKPLSSFPSWFQKLAAECQSAGHPGVLVPIKCDLTKEEEILAMFAAIKEQHKGVDVCINNAGLSHPEQLLSGKTSAWKNIMDKIFSCIRLILDREKESLF